MKTAVFRTVPAMKRGLGAAFWRWPHFTPDEVACKDGSIMVDPEAMDRLEALRVYIGLPFVVHSAYRSPAHNQAVGGAKRSRHMMAEAFDIDMHGHDPHAFQTAAREHGFHGIGRYCKDGNWFMHIDIRTIDERAVWGDDFPYGEDDPAPALAAAPEGSANAFVKATARPVPPEAPPQPRVAAPRGRGGFFRRIMDARP